jgi:serine/threonine protein kinase
MTGQMIERNQLGGLEKVGQGGQGVVYRAPKVSTKFAASMVYKEYKAPMLAQIDFSALAAMPALVEESLSYTEAERLISIAAWPCRIVEDRGGPAGFVMPTIPERFFIPLTTVKGISSTTAEFQHLLNHQSVLDARGIEIDDVQRYSLLREVASGLTFLHKHGVCVGDISPKNLFFSLTPHEAVYFIDCDAMRLHGDSALAQLQTPGWETPAGEELATVYSDTYKLGLLALRLLGGDQTITRSQYIPLMTPAMLRQIIIDTLNNPSQQRPLPEAWTYVLGHAIEAVQHRRRIAVAPPVSTAPIPPPTPTVHARPPAKDPKRPTPSTRPAGPAPPPKRKLRRLWPGDAVKVVAPADEHRGQIGAVVAICDDDDDDDDFDVIVKFKGDSANYAFQRAELRAITAATKQRPSQRADRPPLPTATSPPPKPTLRKLRPGEAVKVAARGDDHHGQVGTVVANCDTGDDDGFSVIVRFKGDSESYAFQRDELRAVAAPKPQ